MKIELALFVGLVAMPAFLAGNIFNHYVPIVPVAIDTAADHRAESAAAYRQALTAACIADGGEPIVGELHVTCLRKWAQQGETLVLWSRRKTP